MTDINKSFTSGGDERKVITIQDAGLLLQLPGYFRGKPHFVSYGEFKHCTVTSEGYNYKVSFFLNNGRNLEMDGLTEYEAGAIHRAVLHGASGALSDNEDYGAAQKSAKKKEIKDKLIAVLVVIALFLFLYVGHLLFD